MNQVVDWIFEHALAITLGSILFVVIIAVIVWASRHHKGDVKHDSEDGFPG